MALVNYGNWQTIRPSEWEFEFFTPHEMRQRDTGIVVVDPVFMAKLVKFRREVGLPLRVNSYYRSPEYDARIGGKGAHTTGQAIDLGCHTMTAFRCIEVAPRFFTRIGIMQKGPLPGRFLHLDMLAGDKYPSPRVWSY